MYISEYYEMIMLCNQGEMGVLGGAPGHPRPPGPELPARRVPVPPHRERPAAASPPGTRRDGDGDGVGGTELGDAQPSLAPS